MTRKRRYDYGPVDALSLTVGAALGLAALSLLRNEKRVDPPTNGRFPRLVARKDARHDHVAPAAPDDRAEDVGPYPRLAAAVADLEHRFKLLTNEWADKESRMDALIKRGHRLRKLEETHVPPAPDEQPKPAQTAAEMRNQILIAHRARGG